MKAIYTKTGETLDVYWNEEIAISKGRVDYYFSPSKEFNIPAEHLRFDMTDFSYPRIDIWENRRWELAEKAMLLFLKERGFPENLDIKSERAVKAAYSLVKEYKSTTARYNSRTDRRNDSG